MLLGIFCLGYRTKDAILIGLRNVFNTLLVTNKAKHILNRLFSCSCSDTINIKVLRKIEKSSILKVYHFSISRASSDRIINFNKNKVVTKSLICQTILVNKVPNFPTFLTSILRKISASV